MRRILLLVLNIFYKSIIKHSKLIHFRRHAEYFKIKWKMHLSIIRKEEQCLRKAIKIAGNFNFKYATIFLNNI